MSFNSLMPVISPMNWDMTLVTLFNDDLLHLPSATASLHYESNVQRCFDNFITT
eukprot:gnl/Chilomastix_caulleri/3969.p2 GENE.gnl/Chilomastix_caulleri/3969~~gnl/Chilomastix_caulleri/3969.p2  ORF type:complete len:54 (+),score=13.96 gnl/Chilomastix_caulleri/3969:302-463(+)